MTNAGVLKRGGATWRKRYEGARHTTPSVDGEGPLCEHGPECDVRRGWPLDGESREQFVARLKQEALSWR